MSNIELYCEVFRRFDLHWMPLLFIDWCDWDQYCKFDWHWSRVSSSTVFFSVSFWTFRISLSNLLNNSINKSHLYTEDPGISIIPGLCTHCAPLSFILYLYTTTGWFIAIVLWVVNVIDPKLYGCKWTKYQNVKNSDLGNFHIYQ